ncbi:MAG: Abi-alpha family protein [Gaiellaceae bacterium]
MSGPDDPKELVKATAEGVTEGAVRAALEPFVAPIAETGQIVTDLIRFQRWKLQHWILGKATEFLEARGLEPKQVSLKVLVPLLEAASLEDEGDQEMHIRWAALLANAAAGDGGVPVSPAFPKILGEITPTEAAILDLLADANGRLLLYDLQVDLYPHSKSEDGVVEEVAEFIVHVENLERLGLVEVARPNRDVQTLRRQINQERRVAQQRARAAGDRSSLNFSTLGSGGIALPIVDLTKWGKAFIAACTPPTGAQTGAQDGGAA